MKIQALFLALGGWLLTACSASAVHTNLVVPLVRGYQLLCNPLNSSDNRIGTILPAYENLNVYFYTNNGYRNYQFSADNPGWSPDGNRIIAPGEGFFLVMPDTNPPSIVFTGEAPDSPTPVPAGPGLRIIGPWGTVPVDYEQLTGVPPSVNSFVASSTNNDSQVSDYQVFRFDGTNWNPFPPTFLPAHGYFVETNYPAVRITLEPQSQSVSNGGTATFTVQAVGSNLAYYWRFNGAFIPGGTNDTYIVSNVTSNRLGQYDVIVSNSLSYAMFPAVATSQVAMLTFITPFPDDTAPPWTRGSTGTTFQVWGMSNASSENEFTFNPAGQPVVRPDGNAIYHPSFQGRAGVWELGPGGTNLNPSFGRLRFVIPNYGGPDPKTLRLQVVYRGDPPFYTNYVPIGGAPAFRFDGPRVQTSRENGWVHELTSWHFNTCPMVEDFLIESPAGGSTAIDQVIIDTICQAGMSPPLAAEGSITAPARMLSGEFSFFLNGLLGGTYITECSQDLTTWTALQTNILSAPIEFLDRGAAQLPRRFYRVRH